jgi:hypothetical protein
MAYFIDLFSPETYEAFIRSSRDISGFRLRHKEMADRIKQGDVFVCYLTRLSRWFGLLEVGSTSAASALDKLTLVNIKCHWASPS